MSRKNQLTINQQLERGWQYLYEIEADESMPEELMLLKLEQTKECIKAVKGHKRLTTAQQEKLLSLEKWYQSYDLTSLQAAVQTRQS